MTSETPNLNRPFIPPWQSLCDQPWGEQLASFLTKLPTNRWPSRSDLNKILNPQGTREDALSLQLGAPPKIGKRRRQSLKRLGAEQYLRAVRSSRYESMIMEQGLIPHRLENIHDLMNAAIWSIFPRSKFELHRQAYLVQQHMDQEVEIPPNGRNPDLDLLTCFDEGGLLLLCKKDQIKATYALLRERDVALKAKRLQSFPAQLLIFGHGILEELCRGFPQVLAMTLVLEFDWPLGPTNDPRRFRGLDLALAAELARGFQSGYPPRALTGSMIGSLPLPSFPKIRTEKTGQSRQASSLMNS